MRFPRLQQSSPLQSAENPNKSVTSIPRGLITPSTMWNIMRSRVWKVLHIFAPTRSWWVARRVPSASPGLVDPYPHFPARLYTNALSPDLDLVRPDWILSHYARWEIDNDHVVVLILSRVSRCSSSFSETSYVTGLILSLRNLSFHAIAMGWNLIIYEPWTCIQLFLLGSPGDYMGDEWTMSGQWAGNEQAIHFVPTFICKINLHIGEVFYVIYFILYKVYCSVILFLKLKSTYLNPQLFYSKGGLLLDW